MDNQVMRMMQMIQADWIMLTGHEDCLKILRSYASHGRSFTILLTIIVLSGTGLFLAVYYMPLILDVLLPLNESRPCSLPASVEFFIDQDKYFVPIMMHFSMLFVIVLMTLLATEALSLILNEHTAGLFEIAGYEFEHIMDITDPDLSATEYHSTMTANLTRSVKIHRRAIKCLEATWSAFWKFYLVVAFLGIVSITIHLYRLYQALLLMNDVKEIVICCTYTWGHMFYIFVATLMAQRTSDRSLGVFYQVYSMPWYEAPCEFQKLILIVLTRTVKHSEYTAIGVVSGTLQTFSKLTNMCLSYFMMLCSINQ